MNYDLDMPPYIEDMADWLDDDRKIHPCNFESAYAGFEIMMALCRSAVDGGQVALPLINITDEIGMLADHLAGQKVLLSTAANASAYPSASPEPELAVSR
jgi:hypothetical protein